MPASSFDEALAIARAKTAADEQAAAQSAPTIGQDVMNSAPSYLARGAAGAVDQLAGATIPGMIGQGADWLASRADTGGHPITEVANQVAPDFMSKEAQTTPGKFVGAVAEGLPYAAAGGGTPLRSLATNVVGSLGGEAAAEIAKGGPMENFARLLGTMGAGGITAGRPANLRPGVRAANTASGVMKPWRTAPMSGNELKGATDFAYQSLRDAGINYDPKAFAQLGPDLFQRLQAAGKQRGSRGVPMQEEAYAYVDRLTRMAGHAPDFSEIDTLSSELGSAIRDAYKANNGTGNQRLAHALETVQDGLDEFVSKVPLQTMPNLQGNKAAMTTAELNAARVTARDLALRNIKSRRVQTALDAAENDPNGFTSGINREFKALVTRPYNRKLFTPGERKMLSDVAGWKSPISLLGHFGIDLVHPNFLSGAAMTAKSAGIPYLGYALSGPVGAASGAGVLAAGTLAKTVGEPIMKRRNANAVADTIRGFDKQAPGADLANKALDTTTQDTNWSKLRWLMLGGQGARPDAPAPVNEHYVNG